MEWHQGNSLKLNDNSGQGQEISLTHKNSDAPLRKRSTILNEVRGRVGWNGTKATLEAERQ
jgi:hypothetical protein